MRPVARSCTGWLLPVMPEGQLEGGAAQGVGEELVTKTDAKDGNPADDRLEDCDLRAQGRGVSGPVGEEDPVGPVVEDLVRAGTAPARR